MDLRTGGRFGLAFLFLSLTAAAHGAELDPTLFAGLKARSIGPAGMSGRTAVVAGVPGDPNLIFVGAATGGLWKSKNGGLDFTPIFDEQPVASIGALAIDPAHPDILWVGTGEGNPRNSASVGNGIYKSLDGGETWKHLGLDSSERIHRILLDPNDPDTAYVAALGPAWGESQERGVYKTVDGGASWTRVLHGNQRTGCADLVMDPKNPRKLIAAMWEFRRWPWFFRSGGPGSGLHVSHDGGESWEQLSEEDGLPSGELGRIGLAIAPSHPEVVYALVEAEKNVLLRSDDGGRSFSTRSEEAQIGNRPFYYADLRVDPQWPDRVYSLWSQVSLSEDGGKSWRILVGWGQAHPDHHAMWIDPLDPRRILEGNDGGVYISSDRGASWRFVSNLPLAQYYHIAVDMDVPYNIYGGMQDNGSWRGPSSVWENAGIRNHHWEEVGFGDGFDTRPFPDDHRRGYSMSQEGFLMRWDLDTGERKSLRPAPAPDDELRFNWNAGFAQDPYDDSTIYFGSQYVHRSTDRGKNWTVISPDLTTNNPDWQYQDESGGLTPDVTGAENFTSIVAIAPSRLERNVLWVGTDDGRLHVTRDGGQNWESLEKRLKGVPANTWISHIAPSPHDAGTAFVVLEDHRRGNWTPYVFRVEDYGRRARSLATEEIWGYCLVIEQDPVDPDLLFLGTEFGLYFSIDAGARWMKWTHGVPTVSVMDLVIHPRENDLILGTHGRAAYVLDDISPLRNLSSAVLDAPLHMFHVADARQHRVRQTAASRFPGSTEFRGENRPYGALISFNLTDANLPHPDEDTQKREQLEKRREARSKAPLVERRDIPLVEPDPPAEEDAPEDGTPSKPNPTIEVKVRDASGTLVREFEREVHRGLNRINWDLSSDPFDRPPADEPDWFGEGGGPEVLPGRYEISLKYGEDEVSSSVTVLADDRRPISTADRQAAWDALQRAGALQELVAEAIHRLVDARADCEFVLSKIEQSKRGLDEGADEEEEGPHAELAEQAREIQKGLGALEGRLRVPPDTKGYIGGDHAFSMIRRSNWFLSSSWERPTPAALAYLDRGKHFLEEILIDYNRFFAEELAAFREAVDASDLAPLRPKDELSIED